MEIKSSNLPKLTAILKAILGNGAVEVVFEKVDGSIRVLNSTLNPAIIMSVSGVEESNTDEKKPARKQSDTSISVFEVNEGKWKSFRLDKLISINTVKVEDILKLIPKV